MGNIKPKPDLSVAFTFEGNNIYNNNNALLTYYGRKEGYGDCLVTVEHIPIELDKLLSGIRSTFYKPYGAYRTIRSSGLTYICADGLRVSRLTPRGKLSLNDLPKAGEKVNLHRMTKAGGRPSIDVVSGTVIGYSSKKLDHSFDLNNFLHNDPVSGDKYAFVMIKGKKNFVSGGSSGGGVESSKGLVGIIEGGTTGDAKEQIVQVRLVR